MKRFAIIPAGGSGKRMGSNIPKQFLKVKGKEIIRFTLQPFLDCNLIDEIIIAVAKEYIEYVESIFAESLGTKPIKVVLGGKERQDSVFAALSSIKNPSENDFIVVHDAARPFLKKEILNKAIKTAEILGNAVVAIPARDTLAEISSDKITNHIERKKTYYIQTPQIFPFEILNKAMIKAIDEKFFGTDESTIVKNFGQEVFISEGDAMNFKITTKADFLFAQKLL